MFYFISILLFYFQFLSTQAEVDITFHDCDIYYYHPDYFKDVECFILEDNKIFANITITNYLPSEITWRSSIIAATMGEYKVPTGFDASYILCESFKDPIIVAPALKALNFSQDECPPPPGTYYIDGYDPDLTLYPDSFPPNNYMVKTEIFNEEKRFFELRVYERIA